MIDDWASGGKSLAISMGSGDSPIRHGSYDSMVCMRTEEFQLKNLTHEYDSIETYFARSSDCPRRTMLAGDHLPWFLRIVESRAFAVSIARGYRTDLQHRIR